MKKFNPFEGFPKELTDYLWELRFNNNKEWFDLNRERYNELFKVPLDDFSDEMNSALTKKTKEQFYYSVSRINRDIRFSKNKEPYRDHKWVVFRRDGGRWVAKPVLFFEIGPDYYSLGVGIYDTSAEFMESYRKKILANIPEFERMVKKYEKGKFNIIGEDYKKKYNDCPENIRKWYQKKNIGLEMTYGIGEEVYSRELFDKCLKKLMEMMSFYEFLYSVGLD